MNHSSKFILSLSAALCCSSGFAQDSASMILSIDKMFSMAEENSKSIKVYHTGVEASDEAVRAARSARLPEIDISISASYIGDGYLSDRDFSNGMNIDMPHFGNNFAIAASQVLYAGGAISSGIEMAELSRQMAALDLQKNRQEVRFLLTGYYLNLYKLNNQSRVLEQNVALTEQVIGNMRARLAQGTALQNDITRHELQLETFKLQLAQVQDAAKIMNHQLVTTLQLPAETVILPDTTLLDTEVQATGEQDWQQRATIGNVELQQAALAARLSAQKLKMQRSGSLPQVALVAEDHFDGPILVEVPTIDSNFNYWFVGIGVKYNLSSLYKNNRNVRQAKLELRKAQEQHSVAEEQIENVVQAAYITFLTSFTDLRTQEKSVELAHQNYNVTSRRYDNDLALLTDMIDAGNMKLSAELNLVNARINLLYNYYKLRYITHSL